MKQFILSHTKLYFLLCWLALWCTGTLLGLPIALNVLLILGLGYLVNIIFVMRLSEQKSPQAGKTCRR